jgi:hypothetical protein
VISFIHSIISNENKAVNTIRQSNAGVKNDLLAPKTYPLMTSGFAINISDFSSYLSSDINLDIDIAGLTEILRSIDIKDLIIGSRVIKDPIDESKDELIYKYNKFVLESKNKFIYSVHINMYYNSIDCILGLINKIMMDLNYIAFVSKDKYEIDEVIEKSKYNLKDALWLGKNDNLKSYSLCDRDCNLEDKINIVTSPFSLSEYRIYRTTNNTPFKSEDYIRFLLSPHIFKLNHLEVIKSILDADENVLYYIMREGGLTELKKRVLTYRSFDIIELFLYCMYIVYLVIEYVLVYTQELHDAARFIYDEIEDNDYYSPHVFIPPSLHNIFRICEIGDDPSLSTEADSMQLNYNDGLEAIDKSYKNKFDQLQKAYINIFKIGMSKILSRKNSLFFKKYYGRIPHLYKQYANDSEIVENNIVGDPGEILSGGCVNYVERMADDSTNLFNELLQLAKKMASTTNISAKINLIKGYCKKFPIEQNNLDMVKRHVLSETMYRIANSILQDNEIYGFTVEGIVQNKKFPPANHIITSLFVKNPHEKPVRQTVGNIFNSEKYILIFAHPENIIKFNNVYRTSASKVIDTFNPKMVSIIEKNLEKATKKYSRQLLKNAADEMHPIEETDPKEEKKASEQIERAIVSSIDMVISQKRRCLQCAGIAHDMIARVTELAKRCVVAMLNTERERTDIAKGNKSTYNSGVRISNNKSINRKLERNKKHIED